MTMMPKWTSEKEEKLLALHHGGMTPRNIAVCMGFTRNAVIGKLWRLRRNFTPSPPFSVPEGLTEVVWAQIKERLCMRVSRLRLSK